MTPMKRLAVYFLALLLALPASAQFRSGLAGLDDSETARAMREHVTTLSAASLEGRKAGSEGEREAAAYVDAQLRGYGVDLLSPRDGDLFGVAREGGDTLRSRNVFGVVEGYDAKLRDRFIVVGARLDNLGVNTMTVNGVPTDQIYYGANGNASGLAMMLELARMVAGKPHLFRRSILFVAFGASRETFAGSWYFLNRSFADTDRIDGMINLDMLGTGSDSFCAYTGFSTGAYPEHDTDRDTGGIIDYESMERELEYIYAFTRTLANADQAPLFRSEEAARKYDDGKTYDYYDCDQPPTFMGHADPKYFLERWVYQYLRYPQGAVEQGIQGRVIVNFVVDTDGKVVEAEIGRSAGMMLDEEALRVVNASPKWKPGKIRGRKVRASISIPVEFKLEKKSSRNTIGIKK